VAGARFFTHLVALALLSLLVLPHLSAVGLRLAAHPLKTSLPTHPWKPLALPSTVLAADGVTLALLHDGVNRRIVSFDEVPEFVGNAVVAAEDKRFWSHDGYDGEAVARAFVANVQAREVTQGGSTITQQLAKQNFVGDEPTVLRKGKELLYAVALEQRLTKEQLLERYLNQVYFGSGAYGVAAAALEFFDSDVSELTVEQGALLASLIRAPSSFDPRSKPDAAIARRNDVLHAMAASGYLPGPAAAAAAAAPLGVVPSRQPDNPEPFVVEAVKREFLANPAFGPTEEDRRRLLLTGGLRIQTTVDPHLQEAARAATYWVPEGLGSAIVAVDPRSGRIVALHDGGAAAIGHFDLATQGSRQPGSTFKPLVAAAALEAGMPEWQQLVGNGPIELDYPGAPEPWRVDNFDESDYGSVGLREAVTDSVNTAFAQLAVALGVDRISSMAERLGIDVERALGPPESRGPSMALGGLTHGVSPLELASAYATFAAGGWRAAPHVIDQVVGPDGRELYRAEPATQVVLDRAVNAAVVDILQDAVSSGTGSAAALGGWEVLGKTGTSEGSADAWFVGAVPVLSTAVWVGHPESGEPIPGLTGGSTSAPIWRAFMAEALQDEKPVKFDTPTTKRSSVSALPLPQARSVTQ
jgi:penicillin-binding protein 1A